jgi:hypothetical protein
VYEKSFLPKKLGLIYNSWSVIYFVFFTLYELVLNPLKGSWVYIYGKEVIS